MNTAMKPIWRMNTGNGVPSDYSFVNVLYQEGELYSDYDRIRQVTKPCDWVIEEGHYNIIAYQTTRTREAKR